MNHPDMPPAPQAETPPRPKAVDTAVKLTIGGTLIGAIGTTITVLDDEFAESVVRDAAVEATPAEIDMMIQTVPIAGIVGVLLTIGLFTLLAVKFRVGRNWARIVLAGLTAFSLVRFLTAAAQTNAELSLMWSLADVACCTAAVVYLFQRESTEFFRAHMRNRGVRP